MANGWVKLDRSIQDHWSWSGSKFSEGQAIVDLHLRANHQPGRRLRIRGCFISLQRGQLVCSENDLASAWSWSRGKVRRFLSLLEKDGSIIQQKNNRATVISLCEYGQEADTAHDKDAGSQYSREHSKKDRNQNNGQNSKQDSTRAKTVQHPNNSRYKHNPLMNGDLGKSIRLIGSEAGTAKSTGINKKEKKKEKEVKKIGKGKMVVADFKAFASVVPAGFSSRTWARLVDHLREKSVFDLDRFQQIVDEIQAATVFTTTEICVECICLHDWKSFNTSWLETSSYYQQMHGPGWIAHTDESFLGGASVDLGQDPRQWLLDESHFLVLEKKITAEQRLEIIAGKLDITPFLAKHVAMCG